jgi:MFS superfamily sulfate permease-like transporter
MGLFKLGFMTILLSDSLVSGYTAAAAFTIMITQIKFLFGLPRDQAAIPSGPFVTPKVHVAKSNNMGYFTFHT